MENWLQRIFNKISGDKRLKLLDREILFKKEPPNNVREDYAKVYVVNLSAEFSLDNISTNIDTYQHPILYYLLTLKPDIVTVCDYGEIFNEYDKPIVYKGNRRPVIKTLTMYTRKESPEITLVNLTQDYLFSIESIDKNVINREYRNREKLLSGLEEYISQLHTVRNSDLNAVASDIFEMQIIDEWDLRRNNYSDVDIEYFMKNIEFINSFVKTRQKDIGAKAVAIRTTCGNRNDYYRQILTGGATTGVHTSTNSPVAFTCDTGCSPGRGIIMTYFT